jgi:hypothetical protein
MTVLKDWTVNFSAQRRDNGAEYHRTVTVKAITQIDAEDIGLRKCRMIGYRNFRVSAELVRA